MKENLPATISNTLSHVLLLDPNLAHSNALKTSRQESAASDFSTAATLF